MRTLLISSNPNDATFFEGACKSVNLDFQHLKTADQFCAELLRDAQAVSIIEVNSEQQYKSIEDTIANKIGLFTDTIDPNRMFFLGSKDLSDFEFLTRSDIFGHFIRRTYTTADQALIGKLFQALVEPPAFGLEKFLGSESKIQILPITNSAHKHSVIESLKNYLEKAGFITRVSNLIITSCDEILMNAIFDAPVDELGKATYASTPRSTTFDFAQKPAEMQIGFNGKVLGIAVIDSHGSIDKKRLLEHIGRSYESSEFKVKIHKAGAGLGLANVYRNCGGLMFSCESGVRTQVTLFCKKTGSFKEFKDQFRFLSTFMYLS